MDKPIIEYDLTKGVFSGPYGSIFIWPSTEEEVDKTLSDWLQLETVLEWNKENNHIETVECVYVPFDENKDFSIGTI
jgi:hypothetical protein